MSKHQIQLGTVQETLLITLWAIAVEGLQPEPILFNSKSIEIVSKIDYEFSKLSRATSSQVGVCLRGQIIDIMSLRDRILMLFPPIANAYRLALTQVG